MLLILVGLVAFVNLKSFPSYQDVVIQDIQFEVTPELVLHGKKLVDHDCAGCHKGTSSKYEGMKFEDLAAHEAFGTIYTPNITQHPEYGIGSYSEGELYRLLRTGVKKNGQVMLPIMPRYVTTSDEDIFAMIAYLKSEDPAVQASDKKHPAYQPSMLAKMLLNFMIQPASYKEKYPAKPAIADTLAYGAYAVNDLYGCYFCHSQSLEEWNLENPSQTPGYLGGGTSFKLIEYEVVSPSLIMDGESDVSQWTIEDLSTPLNTDNGPVSPPIKDRCTLIP